MTEATHQGRAGYLFQQLTCFTSLLNADCAAQDSNSYTLTQLFASGLSTWFKSLKPGSVGSFPEMTRPFVKMFATSKTVRRHFTHLNDFCQREGEPLLDFLTRWKNEIREVALMDDRTEVNFLHSSHQAGPLFEDFILRLPWTYEEAL
nr:uncharacterized protein LOC109157263 [Ipomoea batatas]GME05584.1 uncharacterized protein LOC109157263 [Ipomoea batatas]